MASNPTTHLAALALAFAVWNTAVSGSALCFPHSLYQGHAVWHLLCAVSTAGIFLFYVTEDDPEEQARFFIDNVTLQPGDLAPVVDVEIIANGEAPGGIGEPTTAVVAPALYNAIYAATGKRLRSMPLSRHGLA